MFLKIILLFMVWLVIRRVINRYMVDRARRQSAFRADQTADKPRTGPQSKPDQFGDFTQQKVSDADFEEIP